MAGHGSEFGVKFGVNDTTCIEPSLKAVLKRVVLEYVVSTSTSCIYQVLPSSVR